MPAKSKSQQRLFGMVHAYNKGEFHGSRALRKRIAELSRHISDEDARHFAETEHTGLPEKKAQVAVLPSTVRDITSRIPPDAYQYVIPERSRRRRSFLGSVLGGTAVGAAVGGLGVGAIGGYIANSAANGGNHRSSDDARRLVMEAAMRCGVWGAGRGAAAGAAVGAGIGILDKIRS